MFPTLHAAAADIRVGRLTPAGLLETCLERIDHLEGRVHAWVSVDREGARAEAEHLTAELRRGHWRGPLHGIPIGIKDIFDVADWPTAAGSRLWKNNIAQQDAAVVRLLREAGAVFVGKTVTTQYASFDPPPTRNPWDLSRTPGGSSSGSAAAVVCGMCLGALGSQTGGSITRPASYCGVAGLKPTFGRVDTDGVVPLAASMDHVGAMARCVRDLGILYRVIAGSEKHEETQAARIPPRLGRLRGFFENRADDSVLRMMDEATDRWRVGGAVIAEIDLPALVADVTARHRMVMAVEAAAFHENVCAASPTTMTPTFAPCWKKGLPVPRRPTRGARRFKYVCARKCCLISWTLTRWSRRPRRGRRPTRPRPAIRCLTRRGALPACRPSVFRAVEAGKDCRSASNWSGRRGPRRACWPRRRGARTQCNLRRRNRLSSLHGFPFVFPRAGS